jgi:hypothetical protein
VRKKEALDEPSVEDNVVLRDGITTVKPKCPNVMIMEKTCQPEISLIVVAL